MEQKELAIPVERKELPVKHLSPAIKHAIKQASRILKRDMTRQRCREGETPTPHRIIQYCADHDRELNSFVSDSDSDG